MPSKIQNPKSKILVVGAGPAGSSAAIRLAQKGFRITLVEREKFPREKLCGEFISPECLTHFRQLGVLDKMLSAGGDRIMKTVFYAPDGKSVSVPSKWFNAVENALGLSRAEMDFRLLERAKNVGVKVSEEIQVCDLLLDNETVCGLKIKDKVGRTSEIIADLTIDATGRARVLGKLWERERGRNYQSSKFKVQKPSLVAFKQHLKNADIEPGVCEIYFFRGGYGGLNFVENNVSNHCFLVHADLVKEFNSDARQIVEKVIFQHKRAAETLKNAVPVYDWLAVSIDKFGLKDLNPAKNLIAIGDAAAFIDPFTGSGMLMALESGELLAQCVSESSMTEQIAETYQLRHREKFQNRLRICSCLRRAAFSPKLTNFTISMLRFSNFPRRILAQATRPSFLTSNK